MTGSRTALSFCRYCPGQCALVLDIEDERIVAIRGDKQHSLTQGYACIKGLQSHHAHHGKDRLLKPLKRMGDGTFAEIPLVQALDEIAAQTEAIRSEHGGPALAVFKGTQGYMHVPHAPLLTSFLAAVGSPHYFSTMTIDQSAKYVAAERLGVWLGNMHDMQTADVVMMFGTNPLVSISCYGITPLNVPRRFRDLRQRGGKVIVVDPRRSETAAIADVHLQIVPGEDATLAAGMIREILAQNWQDRDFCDAYVAGMDALAAAVEPFTLDLAASRCGVAGSTIHAAAKMFAHDARRGFATTGTGANMNARSNLTEHLVQSLNVICGRFNRAGEQAANAGVIWRRPLVAQVHPPQRSWERGHASRVRHIGTMMGEAMSATLPEEILTREEGRIRSLFVVGGNPAAVFPDQVRAVDALKALDLLVVVDPFLTHSARLAHYVLPPYLMYERPDFMFGPAFESFIPEAFQQYTGPVLAAPAGSDLIEDWALFYELGQRMGLQLDMMGQSLDMKCRPSTEDLMRISLDDFPVTLDQFKQHERGVHLDIPLAIVAQGRVADELRFQPAPQDVRVELAELATQGSEPGADAYPSRLITRRSRELMNTLGMNFPKSRQRVSFNPAFMHPEDMDRLTLLQGAPIRIANGKGAIRARVSADPSLRPGVVAMYHNFGGLPDDTDADYDLVGSNPSLLIDIGEHAQTINAMPRMTGIPVEIHAEEAAR